MWGGPGWSAPASHSKRRDLCTALFLVPCALLWGLCYPFCVDGNQESSSSCCRRTISPHWRGTSYDTRRSLFLITWYIMQELEWCTSTPMWGASQCKLVFFAIRIASFLVDFILFASDNRLRGWRCWTSKRVCWQVAGEAWVAHWQYWSCPAAVHSTLWSSHTHDVQHSRALPYLSLSHEVGKVDVRHESHDFDSICISKSFWNLKITVVLLANTSSLELLKLSFELLAASNKKCSDITVRGAQLS